MEYSPRKPDLGSLGLAPLFPPDAGVTVIRPPGEEPGFWAGAPTILFDDKDRAYYLYYRLRQPRGCGENERGYEVRIARSEDGEHFEDVWKLHKKELNSSSIERSALVKVSDELYRLYVSYVDSSDNRWRIDVVEAHTPHTFDMTKRRKVFTAADLEGVEGVKDPYVVRVGSRYYMYFLYARGLQGISREDMHRTGDVHNTGHAVASTGLAVSDDGISFDWNATVLPVSDKGWDRYHSRLTTIIPYGEGYTVMWDGSYGVEQNYEEKSGLAVTYDLVTFAKISTNGPALAAYGDRSVRYVDAIVRDDEIRYYYEYTREDGAHELRLYIQSMRMESR